jgi:hypothetical protein
VLHNIFVFCFIDLFDDTKLYQQEAEVKSNMYKQTVLKDELRKSNNEF